MDNTELILQKILSKFEMYKTAQVEGYASFKLIENTETAIVVLREKGTTAKVPFTQLRIGIDAYSKHPDLYNQGPSALRHFGITHVTSPVFALLHLLDANEYSL